MNKRMRVVGYIRASDDDQDGSCDQQEGLLRRYEPDKYEIVHMYRDDGISGLTAEDRPDFRAMTERIALADFEAVLVRSQDRFSRAEPRYFFPAANPFIDAGIGLVCVDTGPVDWDTAIGQAVAAINSFAKNQYVRDLAYNSVGGTVQAVRERGGWVGMPPYGFVVVRVPCPEANRKSYARLVKDAARPERPALALELFERYATGEVSLRALARDLNARGVPPAHGKAGEKWSPPTLKRLLSNPAYCGDTVYNRTSQGKLAHVQGGEAAKVGRDERLRRAKALREREGRRPKGGKKARGQSRPRFDNDPSEWVAHRDTHEPLVGRELFAKVQAALPQRRGRKGERAAEGKGSHAYLFSGLVRCGRCGRSMQGQVAYKLRSGEPVRRYVCSGNNNNGTCRYRVVYEKELIDTIGLGLYVNLVNDPERLKGWVRGLTARLKAEHGAAGKGLKRLGSDIAALAKQVEHGKGNLALLPRDMLAAAVAKVREMEARLAQLEARKAAAGKAATLALDIDGRVKEAVQKLVLMGTALAGQRECDRALVAGNVGLVEVGFDEVGRVVKATGERRLRSVPSSVRVVFRPESLLGAELVEMFSLARPSCRSAAPGASPSPPCP
jgi:DNA invertase Pin-like site-specific DNA recombinase